MALAFGKVRSPDFIVCVDNTGLSEGTASLICLISFESYVVSVFFINIIANCWSYAKHVGTVSVEVCSCGEYACRGSLVYK